MIHRNTEPFPIYDSILLDIIISDSDEKISAVLKPEDRDDTYYACVSRTYFDNPQGIPLKAITVILMTEHSELSRITPDIIVHEAVHVKNKLYLQLGIKNDRSNDEPEAYLMEWLFKKISQEFEVYNKLKENGKSNTTSD